MRRLYANIWKFLFKNPRHPILQRERSGWTYLRLWSGLKRGCLPIMALIIVAPACLCGLMVLLAVQDYSLLSWMGIAMTVLFGVLMGGEVVRMLAGLITTALAATSISAEIESETFALVRLTLVPVDEIILAKFSAAVWQVRSAIIATMVTRTAFMLGSLGIGMIFLMVLAWESGTAWLQVALTFIAGMLAIASQLPTLTLITIVLSGLLSLAVVLITLAATLLNYLFQPLLEMSLYSSLGVFGSSLSRTRSSGLVTTILLRVGLWVVSYISSQVVGLFIQMSLFIFLAIPGVTKLINDLFLLNPAILVILVAAIYLAFIGIFFVVQLGLIGILLTFAINRSKRLPIKQK